MRAERLAEDFKALAYLEHRDLKPVLVPLVTLVLQVRSDLAPRLVQQTATWTVGPLPVVTGDAMLLRQAFTELLHHCLKLVPEGNKAEVEVNASSADGRVTILVEVAPVKAGAGDLRGDGLSTARRVMQRHGATLETELQGEHLQILLQSACSPCSRIRSTYSAMYFRAAPPHEKSCAMPRSIRRCQPVGSA